MSELIILGVVNFAYILLRSLQSRAVNYARYVHICGIGSALGTIEVVYIATVAARGDTLDTILVVTGTAILGCLCAVWVTRSYNNE